MGWERLQDEVGEEDGRGGSEGWLVPATTTRKLLGRGQRSALLVANVANRRLGGDEVAGGLDSLWNCVNIVN